MDKTALVLGGGGAKGSYQAEVATRILEHLDLCAITGISAGALNGSILSQGKSDRLRKIWAETRKSDVWSGGHTLKRYWNLAWGKKLGLYDSDPLYDQVQRNFDPNQVIVPFRAGSVSLESGRYVQYRIDPDRTYDEYEIEKSRKFVCASAAVPGAVDPIKVDEEFDMMVDGGVRNMAPISDALDSDPERIVVILNTDIKKHFLTKQSKPTNIFEVGASAIEILLNETTVNDVRTAQKINDAVKEAGGEIGDYRYVDIEVINPSENIGSPRDFSRQAYEKRKVVAKYDAYKFIDEIA